MTDFETRVLPVVVRFARKMLRDEQSQQDAVGNAWYSYRLANDRLNILPSTFARIGVCHVLTKRDLPGIGGSSGRIRDALDHPDTLRCGSMAGIQDRNPGPDAEAQRSEAWDLLLSRMTKKERAAYRALLRVGLNRDAAAKIGVSPGRFSQLLGAIADKIKSY